MNKTGTPICDFVHDYINKGVSRLHMPGHKGKSFLGCESLDITEISGADDLYCPGGIIEESEKNASRLFGTGKTLYSTEGSSHCIRAMLYTALMARRPGQSTTVLAARNVHKTFIFACALLDIDVCWLYPETQSSLYSCAISEDRLEAQLKHMAQKPFAVFLTSPDYLGAVQDIEKLSEVCKKYGTPLLVDNAHGAYLHFLPKSMHPIALGADMCCDSGHKTLPVLTGGAYLHISKTAPSGFSRISRDALALFGSTSPSYLILQSLDMCNRYLADGYCEKLSSCISRIGLLKKALPGNAIVPSEPLKLTLNLRVIGNTGCEAADALRKNNAECEFCDRSFIVLMFTPENTELDFQRAEKALSGLSVSSPRAANELSFTVPERKMTIRQAVFSAYEDIPVDKAPGRICAMPAVSCPPAVPIAVSGEVITEDIAKLLKFYGFDSVRVVVNA